MDPSQAINGQPAPNDGHVSKGRYSVVVKQTWQQFEDFGLAHKLQNEEFNHHYDHNRSERRLMHGDIRVSKEEQQHEDKFAAEYYEQLRRDRERDDERLALEIQRRIQMEESNKMSAQRAHELQDEMLARRLQDMEMSNKSAQASSKPLVLAGSSNGPYRPGPQRHASIPNDHRTIPPAAVQESHRNYPPSTASQTSSTSTSGSTSTKKCPPPRPPPPRHNSLR